MKNWQKKFLASLFIIGIIGPIFRLTLYPHIPVHPGNAYGIADIVEYFLGCILAGCCLLSISFGIIGGIIPKWRSFRTTIWLIGLPLFLLFSNYIFFTYLI